MIWSQVRAAWPEQWLVVEALSARQEGDRRLLDRVAVVEVCADGVVAMKRCRDLSRAAPGRDLYPVHTRREQIEIIEERWPGFRFGHAPAPAR